VILGAALAQTDIWNIQNNKSKTSQFKFKVNYQIKGNFSVT